MIHIEYSQNNRARYLFPNCMEQENIDLVIQRRMKRYLNKEEYDWAYSFIKTVMGHKDYLKIKEELQKTGIVDLREYHDYLQLLLDNPKTSIHFLDILTVFNQIRRKTNMVISHIMHLDINQDTMSKKEDIEYTLNLIGYYLFQDDSPIIAEIQKKYLEEVKEYQKNGVLNSIIQVELLNIKKKTLEMYRYYIRKYDMVVNLEKKKPTDCYINDSYTKHLHKKIHDIGIK